MNKLILMAATFALSINSYAADFVKGTHYTELKAESKQTRVVTEYFSFYCPHCYNLEPIVQRLKQDLPSGVKFEKKHVSFMGRNMGFEVSKAYATAKALNIEDDIVRDMFHTIHPLRKPPQNTEQIQSMFENHGITKEQFYKVFNSADINSKAKRFDESFQRMGLTGVPAVVVNGKFLANAGGVKSQHEYNELIKYLLNK